MNKVSCVLLALLIAAARSTEVPLCSAKIREDATKELLKVIESGKPVDSKDAKGAKRRTFNLPGQKVRAIVFSPLDQNSDKHKDDFLLNLFFLKNARTVNAQNARFAEFFPEVTADCLIKESNYYVILHKLSDSTGSSYLKQIEKLNADHDSEAAKLPEGLSVRKADPKRVIAVRKEFEFRRGLVFFALVKDFFNLISALRVAHLYVPKDNAKDFFSNFRSFGSDISNFQLDDFDLIEPANLCLRNQNTAAFLQQIRVWFAYDVNVGGPKNAGKADEDLKGLRKIQRNLLRLVQEAEDVYDKFQCANVKSDADFVANLNIKFAKTEDIAYEIDNYFTTVENTQSEKENARICPSGVDKKECLDTKQTEMEKFSPESMIAKFNDFISATNKELAKSLDKNKKLHIVI